MLQISEFFFGVVRDLASDGRGVVAHESGQVFFVSGVWLDEEGEFCVRELKGRSGTAELVRLSKSHEDRITPPCSHHGVDRKSCGGCAWQFINYKAQLKAKELRVIRALNSALSKLLPKKNASYIEQFVETHLRPIISSSEILNYRNRAQFKTDGEKIGFLSTHTRELVTIEKCLVLTENNQKNFDYLKSLLPNSEWNISRAMQKKQHWTRIDVDESFEYDVNSEKFYPEIKINQRLPFQQANTSQNIKMKAWLKNKLLELSNRENILELFCGSGNFTEILSDLNFEKITAVEASNSSIQLLKKKQLKNVNAINSDLYSEDAYERMYRRCPQAKDATILLLDPPREGLKNTIDLLSKKHKVTDVFYISCNLATFVRDLDYFYSYNFVIKELTPLDQFPHTPHIEILCHLTLKK